MRHASIVCVWCVCVYVPVCVSEVCVCVCDMWRCVCVTVCEVCHLVCIISSLNHSEIEKLLQCFVYDRTAVLYVYSSPSLCEFQFSLFLLSLCIPQDLIEAKGSGIIDLLRRGVQTTLK